MTKIPVWQTFKSTLSDVWNHKLEWTRVVYAPMVLLVVASYIAVACIITALQWTPAEGGGYPTRGELHYLYLGTAVLIAIAAFLQLTIKSFRYALLGEDGNKWWSFPLKGRLLKLALYFMLFSCISGVLIGVPSGLFLVYFTKVFIEGSLLDPTSFIILTATPLLMTPLFIGVLYVSLRLCFYNLFIAIETPQPFRSSWHLLKGNVGRFFGLQVLLSFSAYFISYLISVIPQLLLSFVLIGVVMLQGQENIVEAGMMIIFLVVGIQVLIFSVLTAIVTGKGSALVYQTLDEKKTVAKTPRGKK